MISQTPVLSVSALPVQHDILLLVRQILLVGGQSPSPDETLLSFSQKVVQLLFKTSTQLGRDVYVLLLERLCDASTKVAKEAIEWLIYAEDDVSFLLLDSTTC
jgi:CCR4-NOT transcription complex subunit 1